MAAKENLLIKTSIPHVTEFCDDLKKISAKKMNKQDENMTLERWNKQEDQRFNGSDVSLKHKSTKLINSNIFEYFTLLAKSEDNHKWFMATNQLLIYLKYNKQGEEKREKEVLYCLKRLIRGCGASNNTSRCNFYAALVAFLKAYDGYEHITTFDCFEVIDKELHVGKVLNSKEDSDAVVGHILVCRALLKSDFLFKMLKNNNASLVQLVQLLVKCTRHRSYHLGMAYQLLCELLDYLTESQFVSAVWPQLKILLEKPWHKHTLYSVYCLIKVQEKFPHTLSKEYIKCHFNGSTILNKDSYAYIYKIFWQNSNMDILIQPAIHEFGKYLANAKPLYEFWRNEVDKGLQKPTKLTELITLKILTEILENTDVQKLQEKQRVQISKLLNGNFMYMLVHGLKNLKRTQKGYDMINAFYGDFFQALVNYCQNISDDSERIEVIKCLILPPYGTFGIERFCRQRIIHQIVNSLQESGIKDIFELYKNIFLGKQVMNTNNCEEKWLNFDRRNAGYMLQHLLLSKAIQSSYKWREKQLKFLFICGMTYVTEKGQPCRKDFPGQLSNDFGDQCKNIFYNCLQGKIHNLEKEYKLLWNLFTYCDDAITRCLCLTKDNVNDSNNSVQFKAKSSELKKLHTIFENIKLSLHKVNTNNNEYNGPKNEHGGVIIVFKILITYMALQTFKEPEISISAILDLIKCMEHFHNKPRPPIIVQNDDDMGVEEPEWIEVIVDLFLHLLSHNNNCLRIVVNALFPHLCPSLTLTSMHQILHVLNMKDGYNPLINNNIENEEEDETDGSNTDGLDEDNKSDESDADSVNDSDEIEDDDDEDGDDDNGYEEELIADPDKLRSAVSQALIANDAAATSYNGINTNDDNDDMDSINLDDLTEEQGKQLDEALSKAFKAMKKSSAEIQKRKKKTKSQRVQIITLMHFRIRVLDLLDIYIQHNPPLLVLVEIMQQLCEMLPYCSIDETPKNENLEPLQQRVKKLLQKITVMKNFHNCNNDFTENDFVNYIRAIFEQQKSKSSISYDIINHIRNKCIVFLITNSPSLYTIEELTNSKIIALLKERLNEFIKSRNPIINVTLIIDIFKLRWLGIWPLAEYLCSSSLLCWQTRIFRRIQIFEILTVLYKNYELLKINNVLAIHYMNNIKKSLQHHIMALRSNSTMLEGKLNYSLKEYITLLELLMTINKTFERMNMECELISKECLNSLNNIRIGVQLNTLPAYRRFQQMFNLSTIVVENTDEHKIQSDKQENLNNQESIESKTPLISNKRKKVKTRKDMRKLKKLKINDTNK